MNGRIIIAGFGLLAVVAAGYLALKGGSGEAPAPESAQSVPAGGAAGGKAAPSGAAIAEVRVPPLEGLAKMGQMAFRARCAGCHGEKAEGQKGVAPPLVHDYYKPSHHGDAAFMLAARTGVRAHHWRFGNMPPVKGVTDAELKSIIAYVRALQKANGIY